MRGHFGHLLTEQVSRLWAWPEAKALVPDLKLLLGTNQRAEVQPYEYAVYAAAGVPHEDVVMLREPARVERVLSATPMLSNPEYVHPRIAETWRRVGDNLAATAAGGPRPGRVFCSRRLKKRSCTNTGEVEDLFRAEGFEVIYPEDMPLGDQIETLRSADVVAGFAGSGLFNLCFVERPARRDDAQLHGLQRPQRVPHRIRSRSRDRLDHFRTAGSAQVPVAVHVRSRQGGPLPRRRLRDAAVAWLAVRPVSPSQS